MVTRIIESPKHSDAVVEKMQKCKEESIELLRSAYFKFTELVSYTDDAAIEEISDKILEVKELIQNYHVI